MERRNFIAACAATAGAVAVAGESAAAKKGPFSDAPLKMSIQPKWFPVKTTEERLTQAAEWGFPAFEQLSFAEVSAKPLMDKLGLVLSCRSGAGEIKTRKGQQPKQMVNPADHDRIMAQFKENIAIAKQLGCPSVVALTGQERSDVSREKQTGYVVDCLKRLAPIAEAENITIVLEALNLLVNHAGYFLSTTDHAMEIMQEVDSPRVKMLFDIYHQQITEGNVIRNFTKNIDRIGHFHVGDNPGRKQPGTGEINYKNVFKALAETDYDGYVALECGRVTDVDDALTYLREYCLTWT